MNRTSECDRSRNNYETTADMAREDFLAADPGRIAARGGVTEDENFFYVSFLDAVYRVGKATGMAERSVKSGPYEDASDFTPTMILFDYLCLERGERSLSGNWVTTERLGGHVHGSREGGGFFEQNTEYCDAHKAELPGALTELGGVRAPIGDIGFILLPFLGVLPLYFQFRESDQEFPASVTLLWDENTLNFVHYETLYYIAELLFRRLWELIGD
jgi:hypothetical protein